MIKCDVLQHCTLSTKLYVLYYWLCYNAMNGNEIPLKTWSCSLINEQKNKCHTKNNRIKSCFILNVPFINYIMEKWVILRVSRIGFFFCKIMKQF